MSDGIKKCLVKKDEYKQKQKRKCKLLTLKSQDEKSFKPVQSMLNHTKSVCKSVIGDIKDNAIAFVKGLFRLISLYTNKYITQNKISICMVLKLYD